LANAKRPRGGTAARQEPLTAAQVVELATRHNLAELEIEQGGVRIRVVREHAPAAQAPPFRAEPTASSTQRAPAEAHEDSKLVTIDAPMVGTFYRAPGPGAAPFVAEGDVVKEGQVLCIIEAMKLMNEIEAKVGGRIARVLVENAQPVEYGHPLFLVEPR
jgi:acetyl-CoA carboxylase biotin carboxyl carrier protein